jgi:hypothetical protein
MRSMKYLALAGLPLLLAGCVTNVAPPLSSSAAPNAANGVIAGSFSRTKTTDVAFIVRNTVTGREYALSLGENSAMPTAVSDQIMAIDVPPGQYEITQWETFATLSKERFGKYDVTNPFISAPFIVHQGEVVFLGKYFIEGDQSYATLHWHILPQRLQYADARKIFDTAYPAYASNTFSCRLCVESLNGEPVNVKDVERDIHGYMATKFAPTTLVPQVAYTVTSSDSEPLHFRRMVLNMTWRMNVDDPGKTSITSEVRTLTNAGDSFVQVLSQAYHNGVQSSQVYDLTYRGLVSIKTQIVIPSAAFAPQPLEVKNFAHFEPVSSLASGLRYNFLTGAHVETTSDGFTIEACESEGRQPAAALNPALEGDGITLVCSSYNADHVVRGRTRYVYLPQYGVGIPVSIDTPRGLNEAKVDSITIE